MRDIVKIIILMTLLVSYCKGQIGKIKFDYCKSTIKKDEYLKLDSLGSILLQEEMRFFSVKLVNLACEEELKKDKKIGATRAIEIIDYMEKKYKINRNRFYYVDTRSEWLDKKNCKNFSQIELHLTKE
jgi:hypothetical protein